MIETEGLRKSFRLPRSRQTVEAVRGIDLEVEPGEVFGFLGPNGAGKTTTQRMLTTLLPPDGGRAIVAGYDLLRQPQKVREQIGAISQTGGIIPSVNGRENLILQAQLYGLNKNTARARAATLIDELEMVDFADRPAHTYSGGQRRRLDLALGLIHRPPLLFMDEPSLGLDPQSRALFWEQIRQVHKTGITIFLTTHYLDEADNLCDRLAIIDKGIIVAQGTPLQLKREIASDVITLSLHDHHSTSQQASTLLQAQPFVRDIKSNSDGETLQVYVERGEEQLPHLLHLLEDAHLKILSIALTHPSLDDVFLRQTGRSLRESDKNISRSPAEAYNYTKS
jgi:ABC-2 type transport system ATP-binding protein